MSVDETKKKSIVLLSLNESSKMMDLVSYSSSEDEDFILKMYIKKCIAK